MGFQHVVVAVCAVKTGRMKSGGYLFLFLTSGFGFEDELQAKNLWFGGSESVCNKKNLQARLLKKKKKDLAVFKKEPAQDWWFF